MAGQDASVVIETTANITYPDAALKIAAAAELAAKERARPIREKLAAVADTLNRIDIGDIPAPYSTKVNEILDGAVAALAEIEVIE